MRRLVTFFLVIPLLGAAASPATSVRSDILPGVTLTVEEVERGVFRVINDGVRDLVLGGSSDIVAGHDEGIWLLQQNRFIRLGSETDHAWPRKGGWYDGDFEVTPEGTVWVIQSEPGQAPFGSGPLFSSDCDGWAQTESPYKEIDGIAVAPDGTLWASWWHEGPHMRYLGPSGWQQFDDPTLARRLYPTDSGLLYATECGMGLCEGHRYQEGAWTGLGWLAAFDVAPDGTVWLLTMEEGLVRRYADGEWVSWTPEELPSTGLGISLEGMPGADTLTSTFMAAPDGSLWASQWQGGLDGDHPPEAGLWTGEQRGDRDRYDPQCDGLVRFDGVSLDRFLPGRCITMDIAADGSVWVVADDDLYVITSEAATAAD